MAEQEPVRSEAFRDAMRHLPAGVTVVTVRAGEQVHGLTVSAFCSVSPDPPLVAVVIDNRHTAYPLLQQEGAVFAVNILHQDQVELSNRFAWLKDEDRFGAGDWRPAVTGAPVLGDALAWLDCVVRERYAAGTHTVYIGEVRASGVPRPDEPPLLYWNRGYRKLTRHD
ncbi:MAG TPA: flavin reductase family protein [Thermoanaerobaculia bacterium]|jgi:flavin reductase (DIM6/NTAB) family NADH-FMN oxidoreductase RutF|nr:flavin reductase family protein [Thermoanaerobaculia bacterium]